MAHIKKLKHIELFAGCGGMSLGLNAAGFELFMANELSPMAGETFAFNLFGENLENLAEKIDKPQNTLWIKSNFPMTNLKERLRENPFEYSKGEFSDVRSDLNFQRKLLIGNIDDFLKILTANKKACRNLRNQNVDLLSGGPPCQGFSLAGKRKKDDYKNLLPLSFAKFAGLVQPKMVLLENVRGITSPFETSDGVKHFAWLEVAKAFALKGFVPICMLINSKYFGAPQNRPRFIMFAFRKDIFQKLLDRSENTSRTLEILKNAQSFSQRIQKRRSHLAQIGLADIALYDIEMLPHLFDGKLLPKVRNSRGDLTNADKAIGDIVSTNRSYKISKLKSAYPKKLARLFKVLGPTPVDVLANHDSRNHSYKVKARFRLYQLLNELNGVRKDAQEVIAGKWRDEQLLRRVFDAFRNKKLLIATGEQDIFAKPRDLNSFRQYLIRLSSKKHSQRAIKWDEPAPAQMTIPDDLCHYSQDELRTLTVREMARLQSFPDSFIFRSKITTGGRQRSFEVPQYTQVGNAVPPLLAYELGKTLRRLLRSIQ